MPKLQINNKVQHINASLAIQLSYDWLKRTNKNQLLTECSHILTNKSGIILKTCDNVRKGLENCYWPGRCQLIKFHNFKYFHKYHFSVFLSETISSFVFFFFVLSVYYNSVFI